jgi:hypothetical protein
MSAVRGPDSTPQPPEQRRYAQVLVWGTRAGLVVVCFAFAAYVLGVLPAQVPLQDLPRLWSLPVGQYLQATGAAPGWQWLRQLQHGDMASLFGIALLASCSLPALLALVPSSLRRGDRLFAALCGLEVTVIVLAASGWFGH